MQIIINSDTGPSNVQLIQVSVYAGPSLQKKKLLGGAMLTCVHSIKVVHAMQGLLYAGQSFLYISSVCMTVAERHYCLFLGLSVIELVRKFRHRVSIFT